MLFAIQPLLTNPNISQNFSTKHSTPSVHSPLHIFAFFRVKPPGYLIRHSAMRKHQRFESQGAVRFWNITEGYSFLTLGFLEEKDCFYLQTPYGKNSIHILFLKLFLPKDMFLLILEKGRKRERNVDLLLHLLMHSLADSCLCPERGSNLRPWCVRTGSQQLSCWPDWGVQLPDTWSWQGVQGKRCGQSTWGSKYKGLGSLDFFSIKVGLFTDWFNFFVVG